MQKKRKYKGHRSCCWSSHRPIRPCWSRPFFSAPLSAPLCSRWVSHSLPVSLPPCDRGREPQVWFQLEFHVHHLSVMWPQAKFWFLLTSVSQSVTSGPSPSPLVGKIKHGDLMGSVQPTLGTPPTVISFHLLGSPTTPPWAQGDAFLFSLRDAVRWEELLIRWWLNVQKCSCYFKILDLYLIFVPAGWFMPYSISFHRRAAFIMSSVRDRWRSVCVAPSWERSSAGSGGGWYWAVCWLLYSAWGCCRFPILCSKLPAKSAARSWICPEKNKTENHPASANSVTAIIK